MRWWGLAVIGALAVSGCVMTGGDKPLLTKRAFHRLAARCGVTPTEFGKARSGLPYVRFRYANAALESDVRAGPSVDCVAKALKAYRYQYYGPDPDPARPGT